MRIGLLAVAVLMTTTQASAAAQGHVHAQGAAEQIGTVHLATSCAPATAARFDRGVALMHSFEFGSAIRAFNDVLATDSTCAMAYWGIALSNWLNPMVVQIRGPAQLKPGREAADAATRLAAAASERERGYANAVAQLFNDYEHADQRTRLVAYERAMRDLVAAQPQDTEATIFYALSLTASAPPSDKTYANQLKAAGILEPLFAKQPNHPGLAHYLIHAYDYPALAAKGGDAARRYASIAPSSAHAIHMPSHIFTRVGWWTESIESNQRAIVAATRDGSIAEALHASDYAMYANLQLCRDSSARVVLESVPALEARFDPNSIGAGGAPSAGVYARAAIPARYAIERRAWTEAASLPVKGLSLAWAEGVTYFARALGAAHVGDTASARASIDSLGAISAQLASSGENYWAQQAAIQRLEALAWLELATRRNDSALSHMREAAAMEDATEKSPVTPGPLAPARELLGDMLMDLGQPAEALTQYRIGLTREPNRYRLIAGLMRAASASGDLAAASRSRDLLGKLCSKPNGPPRAELRAIRG